MMTPVINEKTIKNKKPANAKAIDTQVKESKNKVKETFVLSTYDALQELLKLEALTQQFYEHTKDFYVESKYAVVEGKESIYNLIRNRELLLKIQDAVNKSKSEDEKSLLTKSVAALTLRCFKVRLKLYFVHMLLTLSNTPNFRLNQKFNQLLDYSKKRNVHMDLENKPKTGPEITVRSTIDLIIKELQGIELRVKELLPGFIESYNLPMANELHNPNVRKSFQSILQYMASEKPYIVILIKAKYRKKRTQ